METITYDDPVHGKLAIWFTPDQGEDLIKAINEKMGKPLIIYPKPQPKHDEAAAE